MSDPFLPLKPAEITWNNGVPCSAQFNDIYFSLENGLQEAQYVYINGNNLPERWEQLHSNAAFVIGEIGFGTGLNFLLSLQTWLKHAPDNATLYYFSCEKHPLTREDLQRCLEIWPEFSIYTEDLLSQYPSLVPGMHYLSFLQGRVKLTLLFGDAKSCYRELLCSGDRTVEPSLRSFFFDAWYLDGFTPKKNPDVWQADLLHIMALLSRKETTLSSYSGAAIVKQNLQVAGFNILKKKGFTQKRSMLTASFNAMDPENHKLNKMRNTPWHLAKRVSNADNFAVIIGAGLAGSLCANALARRGWKVVVLEEQSQAALGASANRQGILYPQLSAYRSPLTAFTLQAYLFALQYYKSRLNSKIKYQFDGILQLVSNERERANRQSLLNYLQHYPDLARAVDAYEATQLCGIPIEEEGLFISSAGWIDTQELCLHLLSHENISVQTNIHVESIQYKQEKWDINSIQTRTLILANGFKSTRYLQSNFIPMKSIAGQISYIDSTSKSEGLCIPICGKSLILPANEGMHAIGATYHLAREHIPDFQEDDYHNQMQLNQMLPHLDWPKYTQKNWQGVRAACPDYLPAVGAIADSNRFTKDYARLADNAKRWLPNTAHYLPGLFICAGFGSRGLTTAPICAELLANTITNSAQVFSQNMLKAISPSRFLIREIIHKRQKHLQPEHSEGSPE